MMKLILIDEKRAGFTGNTYPHKEAIKYLPGREWNQSKKMWLIPLSSVPDAVKRFGSTLELDPQLQLLVAKELELRKQREAIKQKKEATLKGIKGVKAQLMPHQAVGVEFLDTLSDGEGAILAFDMGLGKTLTTIATVEKWMQEGIVKYCLIVCPSPLKYSAWEMEIRKWTENPSCIVVDGTKPVEVEWEDGTKEKLSGRALREVQYQQWHFGARYIIMNYELFIHDGETYQWEKARELTPEEVERKDELKEELGEEYSIRKAGKKYYLYQRVPVESILPPITQDWVIVLDECHRIKNPQAVTTKRIRSYLKPARRKILLTGTPLENNVQELWAQVDFCRPGMLGNYFQFTNRYMEKNHFGAIVGIKPYMMDELKKRLDIVILRKTKEEALPDLPPLTVQDYWVEMTDQQRKVYEEIESGIVEMMKRGGEKDYSYLDVLAQITRLQQACDSPALLRKWLGRDDLPVESGKLKELEGIIEDLNPHKNKFILFSQYREMTDILYQWLIDRKILKPEQIGYVKGGLDPKTVGEIQDGFQNGGIQCVLMTTAGNYGLNLYAGSYVICYDQLFNPQKMEQIYSRCHRKGAKNAVTVINLVTRDTYEERKMNILQEKRELFAAMIDEDEALMKKLFGEDKEALMNLIAG